MAVGTNDWQFKSLLLQGQTFQLFNLHIENNQNLILEFKVFVRGGGLGARGGEGGGAKLYVSLTIKC